MRSFSSSSTFLSSPAGCPGSPCDTNRLPSPPGVSPPSRHPPGDEPDVTYRELTCPRISPERPVRCELARVPARAYPEEPGTLGGDLGGSKGRPSALQFPTNSGRLRWPGKPADARRRGDPPLPSEPVHQSVAAGAPYRKSEKTFPGASTWLSVVGTSRKVVSLFGSGARTGRRQARSRQSGFRAGFRGPTGLDFGPRKWRQDAMTTDYVQLSDLEKLKLLKEHSFQAHFASLSTQCWCMHCEKQFDGYSVRVWKGGGQLWLECGTPECDGSPIDWSPYPWWNGRHPATRAARKLERLQRAKGDSLGSEPGGFAA